MQGQQSGAVRTHSDDLLRRNWFSVAGVFRDLCNAFCDAQGHIAVGIHLRFIIFTDVTLFKRFWVDDVTGCFLEVQFQVQFTVRLTLLHCAGGYVTELELVSMEMFVVDAEHGQPRPWLFFVLIAAPVASTGVPRWHTGTVQCTHCQDG